ncbi:MAG: aldehyde ferredoxin oxidoreductase N-terminal domain-containing protein [Methanomassiliicoccales archaeon]|jgi:aldehyde:ferredoxin oxidoreductase|nr:aldehyde ferredoxin oxidoreductase N-terminal domain-containing protein [Methanomassiliicoccales archaeon]
MDYMYTGNMIIVDLEKGEVHERSLDDDIVIRFLGGATVNNTLYQEFQDKDPVIIGTGLFTSSMIPCSSMSIMTARSPITGKVMHAPIVNFMGAELKLAGFDFIVIYGRSDDPAYLWLHDEIADILPAKEIWGKDTWKTVDYIRDEQGEDRIQVVSIGQAGENKGTIAQFIVNYWSEGDKVGFGARLGEMQLKAIGTRGMGELEVADAEPFFDLCVAAIEDARKRVDGAQGIRSLIPPSASLKNFDEIKHRDSACFGCPWPCRTFVKYNEPASVLKEGVEEPGVLIVDAPGYLAFLNAGFDAIESARLLELSSRLGIEPINASNLIQGQEFENARKSLVNLASQKSDVSSVVSVEGAYRPDVFSPFAPNGGDETAIALAYILGICPRYAARLGIDVERVSEFIKVCIDLDMEPSSLKSLARTIFT